MLVLHWIRAAMYFGSVLLCLRLAHPTSVPLTSAAQSGELGTPQKRVSPSPTKVRDPWQMCFLMALVVRHAMSVHRLAGYVKCAFLVLDRAGRPGWPWSLCVQLCVRVCASVCCLHVRLYGFVEVCPVCIRGPSSEWCERSS